MFLQQLCVSHYEVQRFEWKSLQNDDVTLWNSIVAKNIEMHKGIPVCIVTGQPMTKVSKLVDSGVPHKTIVQVIARQDQVSFRRKLTASLHCLSGARCGCGRHCVHRILSPVQVVHIKADKKTAEWPHHTWRFSLHQRLRFYVHQVGRWKR